MGLHCLELLPLGEEEISHIQEDYILKSTSFLEKY